MKSLWLNLIAQKTDEIVDEVNKLPQMVAATEANALEIQGIINSKVDIPQKLFDEMKKEGTLDITKEYNTYEE